MKLYIIPILILLFSYSLLGQNRSIDSLTNLYTKSTETNERIALKCKISQGFTEIGDFNNGGKFAEEALKEATEAEDKKGIGVANYTLARLNQYMRDWDKALIYHYKAVQLLDEADAHEDLAWSYLNMGISFHAKKDYRRATRYCNKALEIFSKIDHKQGIAYTCLNLGLVVNDDGNTDSAMVKLANAKRICIEIGDQRGIGYVHNIKGDILLKSGKLNEALIENLDCIKIREKENDKRDLAFLFGNIGNIYFQKGESVKAQEALTTAEKMGLEINAELALKKSYLTRSKLDSLQGDYKNAYAHFKKHHQYATLLKAQEHERNVAAIEYASAQERKELEQKLTEEKNEEIAKNATELADGKSIQIALTATGSAIILLLLILLIKKGKKN